MTAKETESTIRRREREYVVEPKETIRRDEYSDGDIGVAHI